MKISNSKNTERYNFKALPVAKIRTGIKGVQSEISLYKLDSSDIPFAKKMLSKINLKKLFPDEKSYQDFAEWKNIIASAIRDMQYKDNVILAVQDKTPCGIISYTNKGFNEFFVGALATWPVRPNKSVKLAGHSLVRKLFEDSQLCNKSKIWLVPSEISPRGKNCIEFYKKLGFEFEDGFMTIERSLSNFARRIAQLDNLFEYKYLTGQKNVNLKSKLNLTFDETLMERITRKIKERFKN